MTRARKPDIPEGAEPRGTATKVYFSVASALLRELGERLVGRPHIALAELIKNSYDADATKVLIRFQPDGIEVVDNGHGMTLDEFQAYWMRIGSPHKQKLRFTRGFKRPMTGSKGVGRLAVQFLARKLEVRTLSSEKPGKEIVATVNWDEAVEAGDLTQASALLEERYPATTYPDQVNHGTALLLSGLNQAWPSASLVGLAREIWWLQPPFGLAHSKAVARKALEVQLEGAGEEAVKRFDFQMRAYLDVWQARLVGKLVQGASGSLVQLALEFADRTVLKHEFPAGEGLHAAEFEVRIYKLQQRQHHGISVQDARDYLKKFGGVHVYDAGFHLPYYGPDTDWLKTEIDHSHRLSTSQLLPTELQVERGMNYLPTLSRMLGIVQVDTAQEQERAETEGRATRGDHLQIQVTRDRLLDNGAYQTLRTLVRYALDYYAMQEATRALRDLEARRPVEPAHEKLERIRAIVEAQSENLSTPAYRELKIIIAEALEATEFETEAVGRQAGLLGSLATAGIAALAFEHEIGQQFGILDDVIKQLRSLRVAARGVSSRLADVGGRLSEFVDRARATRALFSHLLDQTSREERTRYKARALLEDLLQKMEILGKEWKADSSEVDDVLRLPKGTLAEWTAIFQNVVLNAANAMIDTRKKVIKISSHRDGRSRAVLIQDTGVGVDLDRSEDLFKPFVRRLKISRERQALGLGGTGLGLTIVRMIAGHLGCRVRFVTPGKGFRTAFELSWGEKE